MLRLTVEAAPNAMVMAGDQGKIVLVNSQTEVLFGYAREEFARTDGGYSGAAQISG
jgi:PAS domain S-box-containing protein